MPKDKAIHGLDADIDYALSAPTHEAGISFLRMRCREYHDPDYHQALITALYERLYTSHHANASAKRALKRGLKALGDKS